MLEVNIPGSCEKYTKRAQRNQWGSFNGPSEGEHNDVFCIDSDGREKSYSALLTLDGQYVKAFTAGPQKRVRANQPKVNHELLFLYINQQKSAGVKVSATEGALKGFYFAIMSATNYHTLIFDSFLRSLCVLCYSIKADSIICWEPFRCSLDVSGYSVVNKHLGYNN